ncbi:hypothetical protein PFMC_03568 [Plasmodium falciparum CAMP/Malaysia]|uniref:Plasmodium falciparum erythrocyte membrane protein 1 acidic terminal segment domain-containing protein n=1 Tax=Plasmodium falciparum (isolate Camp / Malaysia) TaxID=5835 RepID=A0A024X627_PLAFC|nr:hypothetical protein PFMC_03568 [Plasmodium falciparum CAMP/Malaysia]
MLKRKENELFGTYHTKYTTFNSVSKQTPSDPIINQLDLYHKWIDKHRDICEQWKTKEDMLYKSNEVWNMERKEYLLDIQPSTLDDIHKINDETYNIISTNNIYDHPSQETPLQLLGSTNIIPSYITTEQNNGLRTNISMDTYIDETNNNNVVATSIIVHYINILLFSLPLNILEHNKNEPHPTPNHTQTTRSLCECKLYSPANYDSDPQMKEVMQQFEDRTSQRFHEYDERMKTTRQKCREQCDKEIEKIILKDKLEKELMDKFATLQTDIQNDAIPTCVCEKSLEDKMEKECLKCAQNLGGIVAPSTGVLGEIAALAVNAWKTEAIVAATQEAIAEGAAQGAIAGKAAGMYVVTGVLRTRGIEQYCPDIFKSIQKIESFTDLKNFVGAIINKHGEICSMSASGVSANEDTCKAFDIILGIKNAKGEQIGPPARQFITRMLEDVTKKAELTADDVTKTISEKVTKAAIETSTGAIDAASTHLYTTIAYSILAILIIVLIMVIIYLILRYRRKKKMKKKLQYIKLLEE